MIKLTGLNRLQSQALSAVLSGEPINVARYDEPERLVTVSVPEVLIGTEVTKTTATFPCEPWQAMSAVADIINQLPGRQHPKASLHAVRRRLSAATRQAVSEAITAESVIRNAQHGEG